MKILVLAGGDSAERDVSLESGQCVADALRERKHQVDVIDPRDRAIESLHGADWDVAFPMVHGTGGEDGRLQRQLLAIDLPYVGSSAEASELTFDKLATSRFLKSHGLTVPRHITAHRDEDSQAVYRRTLEIGAAVVTKPPRQGSSIGVSIVSTPSQLPAALQTAFQYGNVCLIEEFISGREVTVPVVDGIALPQIEIRAANGWYNFAAKYVEETTTYLVASPGLTDNVSTIAAQACRLCDVTGIARVDFIVDDSDTPWLLEINTIPGMTTHSLVPKSAAAIGLTLGELCEQAIHTRLNLS